MAWPFSTNAEIAHRSHQPLAKVVLPGSIDDDPRHERPSPVLAVGDPLSQRAALQRAAIRWGIQASGSQVIAWRPTAGHHAQKTKFQRLLPRIEISSLQKPRRLRLGLEVLDRQCRWR